MAKADRRKALDYQAAIAGWLEERGWRVVNLPIGGRWSRVRDVFGTDIIAKHPKRSITLWIQATADPKASWKRKAIPMELVPWNWDTDRIFIFVRKHPGDWEVRRLVRIGLQKALVPAGRVLLSTWIPAKGRRFDF